MHTDRYTVCTCEHEDGEVESGRDGAEIAGFFLHSRFEEIEQRRSDDDHHQADQQRHAQHLPVEPHHPIHGGKGLRVLLGLEDAEDAQHSQPGEGREVQATAHALEEEGREGQKVDHSVETAHVSKAAVDGMGVALVLGDHVHAQ